MVLPIYHCITKTYHNAWFKKKKKKWHHVGSNKKMSKELLLLTSNTARTVSNWSSRRVILLEIFLIVCMDCRRTSSISSLNMSTRKSRHFSAKEGEDWASMQRASTAAMRTSRQKAINKTAHQVKSYGKKSRIQFSFSFIFCSLTQQTLSGRSPPCPQIQLQPSCRPKEDFCVTGTKAQILTNVIQSHIYLY